MAKFQRSETTRAQVSFYSFGDEPGLVATGDGFDAHAPGGELALVAASTQHALGTHACRFTVDLKATREAKEQIYGLSDDDWLDIIFTKHGAQTHVVRGQIDGVRRSRQVVNGATVDTYQIIGSGYGRAFALTPIWFDMISDGALGAGALARVIEASKATQSDPATTTEALLAGFLRELQKVGRSMWPLPPSLPNLLKRKEDDEAFLWQNICFFDRDYVNHPNRVNAMSFSLFPGSNQMLWEFAQGWADLDVCELFTDLLSAPGGFIKDESKSNQGFLIDTSGIDYVPPQNDPDEDNALIPLDSVMGVVFRDRPFPTITRLTTQGEEEKPEDGPWFKRLPLYIAAPEHTVGFDLARSGMERKNAFYAAPRAYHEITGGYWDLNGPLWRPDDLVRHGHRRLDTVFDYVSPDMNGLYDMTQIYKQRMRDYHCMNHLFWSGSIPFGHGRPDIRVGTKLRITDGDEETQETFYVEAVAHSWKLDAGLRTEVGVTRGFIGSDALYMETFNDIVSRYRRPAPQTGIDEAQPEPRGPPATATSNPTKLERYRPFSQRAIDLFTQAAITAGLPTSWADPREIQGQALHELLVLESQGFVGIPNSDYGRDMLQRPDKWPQIHADIKNGIFTVASSATGLGQLTSKNPNNTGAFYPSGRNGIGIASEEAVGMLRYIAAQQSNKGFSTPFGALAFHKVHHFY